MVKTGYELKSSPGPSWYSQIEILVEALYPDDSPENGLGQGDGGVGVNIRPLSAEEVAQVWPLNVISFSWLFLGTTNQSVQILSAVPLWRLDF